MPPSAAKDCFTVLGIHPAPAHLSKSDFESKIETFLESILALPIAQKYFLKTEIVGPFAIFCSIDYTKGEQFFQTKELAQLEGSSEGSWLPEPEPTMCIIKYEFEVLNDPELLAVFLGEKEVGFNTLSTTFAADSSRPSMRLLREHKHVISLFKGLGLEAFEQQVKIITGIPAAQKNILKHSVYIQNNNLESRLQALGRRPIEHIAVVIYETERLKTLENLNALFADAEVKKVVGGALCEPGCLQSSHHFIVHRVTQTRQSLRRRADKIHLLPVNFGLSLGAEYCDQLLRGRLRGWAAHRVRLRGGTGIKTARFRHLQKVQDGKKTVIKCH
ncbi:hypothetical protein B0H10DRAFT_1946028 [Mycena sp. CBHHK59/15]|nr:hypothetical protein B0H10DRAFT_1946028 [Mycena sp. CBHHK59/15]